MQAQKSFKVLLIGDSCTDKYVYGEVKRLNPEAPVPILNYKRTEVRQGMCWNVYNNIRAFGVDVYMMTNEEKIVKTRYIDEKTNQQILRLDEEVSVKPMNYELPDEKYDVLEDQASKTSNCFSGATELSIFSGSGGKPITVNRKWLLRQLPLFFIFTSALAFLTFSAILLISDSDSDDWIPPKHLVLILVSWNGCCSGLVVNEVGEVQSLTPAAFKLFHDNQLF